MKRTSITKLLSGLLNILTCLTAVTIILIGQDFFGKGDVYAFFFWTVPLAIGLSISGHTILILFRAKLFLFQLFFIILTAGLISFGWIYFVYLILGPWINTFSFPIFYVWIIGNMVQLLFLKWRLPKPPEEQNVSKLFVRLLFFPLTLVVTVIAIFFFFFLGSYFTRPEKETYLIPNNFEGKFRVVYGEECGLMPPFVKNRRILQIPDNGILIIQPKFKAGTIDHEYYLVDKSGNRQKINMLWNYQQRVEMSPGVLLGASGSMGGEMPDGSFSSESPLAIHFTDFTVYNKDTASVDDRHYTLMERKFDSLTTALVDKCRQTNK